MISTKNKAILAAFLATIFYAVAPVLMRISEGYVSPNSLIFNRAWISSIILLLLALLRRRSRAVDAPPSPESMPLMGDRDEANPSSPSQRSRFSPLLFPLLWVAFTFFCTQMLWAWSINQTTVASSEVLHSLSPPITALASWILFAQMFGRQLIVGIALATIGTMAIFAGDLSNLANFRGDGIALLSALFYAGYLMSVEKLRQRWGSIETVLWGLSSTVLFCIPVIWITGDIAFASSWRGWLSLVLCSLDSVVTLLLLNYCLKSLSSALTATILLISPGLTALLGWRLFSEILSWLNIVGFMVVLVGIYYSVSGENKQESAKVAQ